VLNEFIPPATDKEPTHTQDQTHQQSDPSYPAVFKNNRSIEDDED